MVLEKFLVICSECKSIKINPKRNLWLKRETNPKLYDKTMKKYENRLSHSLCPEDEEKYKQRYGL